MHHEAAEREKSFLRVVGLTRAAALGVRDRDDAVDRRMDARERLQPRDELPREARGARRRPDDHDEIPRADAAVCRTAETLEGARRHGARKGGARWKRAFIEAVRRPRIASNRSLRMTAAF